MSAGWRFFMLLGFCAAARLAGEASAADAPRPTNRIIAAVPVDFPPTYFRDPATGRPAGFAIDVMNAVARRAGLEVEYVTGKPWDEIHAMVLDGRADLIPNLVINDKRQKLFIFTREVETITINFTARATDTAVQTATAGMKVGVIGGSTAGELLADRKDLTVVTYESLQHLIMDLLAGHVDLALTPTPNVLKLALDTGIENRLRILQPPLQEGIRAMALRPSDTALRDRLNGEIEAYLATPEYQRTYQRWWGKPVPFWTPARLATTMGGLLLAVTVSLLLWRYNSMRRAHAALRESELSLQALLDNVDAGVIVIDPVTHRIEKVNPRAIKMFGLPETNIIGQPCYKFLCPLAKGVCPITDLGQTVDHAERTMVQANGEALPVLKSVRQIRLGQAEKLLETFVDISDRKRAEDALRESQQRLALAADSAKIGIWDWDILNDRMTWDEQMLRLYGLGTSPQPFGIERWQQTIHPDDLDRTREAYQAALRGEREYDLDFRICLPGGAVRHLKASGLVQRDPSGRAIRMLGVNYDITERVQLAERLRQREKMDAIGQLAGGIAHDFNNQLAGILGYAEMLADRLEDPNLHRYADGILKASLRAADLTRQLLAFSRKGKYLAVPVDIHTAVAEVVELLSHSIDKRISIRQRLEASPCRIIGDPVQLQNAVLNLALNARDAMPGGGELIFATRLTELKENAFDFEIPAGTYLELAVTDTGCGLTREVRRHLFEPFFTTKEQGKGTGLGLASIFGTVKNHHGAITVYSEPGKGSTFKVYLPLAEGEDGDSSWPAAEVMPAGARSRLLLVDDEKVVADMAADMLRELGHQVVVYNDPVQAVEYYRQAADGIDLVILDMVMPKLGGREVYLALRQINPQVRTLLASGYSINGEAQTILDMGVLGFLQKPFRRVEMARKLAEVLGDTDAG